MSFRAGERRQEVATGSKGWAMGPYAERHCCACPGDVNRCIRRSRARMGRWERRMQGFKSPGHAQRFLSAYGPITQHFRPGRHLLSASEYRQEMRQQFESWAEITGTEQAA
jgi:hypothetical protein